MSEDISRRIEKFFGSFPVRSYKKGQILILNGDEPKTVYLLVEGRVKQYGVDYRGEEIVLNLYKPGAFFPMNFALNGGESPFIFEADSDVELRQAPAQEVVDFISINPEITLDLLKRVFRGTDALLGRIFQLASGSAKSRLAYELSIAAKRFGTAEGDAIILSVTEKDLAARAGLSRETVSREMSKLKNYGLAELKDGQIIIPNLEALESVIE